MQIALIFRSMHFAQHARFNQAFYVDETDELNHVYQDPPFSATHLELLKDLLFYYTHVNDNYYVDSINPLMILTDCVL